MQSVSLSVNRDPAFWLAVSDHPVVAELMGRTFSVAEMQSVVGRPNVVPLASANGGFIFFGLDSSQRVYELHTLFRPEGWGREVHAAAKQAFNRMFAGPCEIIVTNQMAENPHSQPPRSFGFRAPSGFAPSPFGDAKTWLLTRDAWVASPGGRSSCQ